MGKPTAIAGRFFGPRTLRWTIVTLSASYRSESFLFQFCYECVSFLEKCPKI